MDLIHLQLQTEKHKNNFEIQRNFLKYLNVFKSAKLLNNNKQKSLKIQRNAFKSRLKRYLLRNEEIYLHQTLQLRKVQMNLPFCSL